MQTIDKLKGVALGAFIIFLMTVGSLVGIGQAAPVAAPTPIANLVNSNDTLNVTFQSVTSMTTDTNTGGQQLPVYEWLDIQYVIDHGTATNTITITVQFSNNNSNWVSGPAIVSGSIADGSDITRIPLFGRYVRFNQDVWDGDTDPVTVTLIGLAK